MYFYTALMTGYSRKGDWEMALKIVEEMQERGLVPNIVVYTTLINSLRVARRLEKCWEVHRVVVAKKIELDESYTSVMLKVHAAVPGGRARLTTRRRRSDYTNRK